MPEEVCGVPPEQFLKVCEAVTKNSGRERTTAWVYSVGWTQHSVGAQYIRTASILQALLGNIGRPGGGILALRGHASIQGSTDIPTLFNLLPGYLPMPHHEQHETFRQWVDEMRHPGQKGFWANAESYALLASLVSVRRIAGDSGSETSVACRGGSISSAATTCSACTSCPLAAARAA